MIGGTNPNDANTIALNTGDGVRVEGGTGNSNLAIRFIPMAAWASTWSVATKIHLASRFRTGTMPMSGRTTYRTSH